MLTEGRGREDAEKAVLSKPRREALEETALDPLCKNLQGENFQYKVKWTKFLSYPLLNHFPLLSS